MNRNMNPALVNLGIIKGITPKMRYAEGENFFAWQKRAKEKLAELLGIQKIKTPEGASFEIEYKKECEGFTEYRLIIESEENYSFPAVLRVPEGISAPMPLIICLQGHSTGFHISLGKPKYEKDEALISSGDRDFCVQAVKEGFAALAIEQRNFGECGGKENGGINCHTSSMSAIINGRTTIGERVHDVSRAIDVMIESFDFIDTGRIMIMGNSGGGTASYYAAAMDERIALCMPSCAVCTYKDSIAAMFHCTCNFIPNIANYFDMGDLGGLIAPRKLIVVHGKHDDIFPEAGVYEAYDEIKRLYAAAKAEDKCRIVTGDGGHRFYAADSWPVLHKMMEK